MVPYICLYKTVCDLSYRCICVTIDVYGTYICLYKTVCDLSYRCIWYPIFVYIRQCVTCLIDVYGILYLFI